MEFVKFTGKNFPPIGEMVFCRTKYQQDSTPAFWVDPKDRKGHYIVLYWDGEVWRDGWNGRRCVSYLVTHYAFIEPPDIE